MTPRKKAVLLAAFTIVALLPVSWYVAKPAHGLVKFSSYLDLEHFIASNSCRQYAGTNSNPGGLSAQTSSTQYNYYIRAYDATRSSGYGTAPANPQHSGTNNQVSGVDELDIVKTDGEYIYSVTNNRLVILQAYPVSGARIVSRIQVNGTLEGVFIDGAKLALLTQDAGTAIIQPENTPIIEYSPGQTVSVQQCQRNTGTQTTTVSMMPANPISTMSSFPSTSSILVFDSSNHSRPVLRSTVTVSGAFVDARLIGDFVYLISSQTVYCCLSPVVLPQVQVDGVVRQVSATDVYHSDLKDAVHSFTNVVGLNIAQSVAKPVVSTFLLGTSSTIYVSLSHIYLTSPAYSYGDRTIVHRIGLDGERVGYEASGEVPGYVLNQFSMDEYRGHFRVATTNTAGWWSPTQKTSLYVMDMNLNILGSIEGLSPGEKFYSARFIQDRAYLVTYRNTDPLFVIDLKDPARPKLLGQLEVTGYSDYLQPLDETHLIGIGKMAAHTEVKVSLFDVADPTNPAEVARYTIGNWNSETLASRDHKAVLLDTSKQLLVIPAEVNQYWQANAASGISSCSYGQAAFVFNVTSSSLSFRGSVSHQDNVVNTASCGPSYDIARELYIGNVLYTISKSMVKMNSLQDLKELGQVNLAP